MPGIGAMSIVYRRERGAPINDIMELGGQFHGRRVVACYGAIRL